MADLLINHLKEKGKGHSDLAMLVNQWGFDEKLIPKALQTIVDLFPHYSRHDESHSKQILVNIERLLGDNIQLLTATDTWMILEAAYWHDIGMVVPQKDMVDAINQPAFQQYVDSIRNNSHHELYRFANSFDIKDMSKCFSGADAPMEAVDKFRQLMAEWFRRQHASRSEHMVQAPWASAGINSPRTELIPARLFKTLGRICQMHGMPFAKLLSGLPFREAGPAQEDCHPRFVACLLRMGDLLDLDDNRFCPVMQRIAGDHRSHLSRAHEDKHAGIRHLRVDRERIEISAECETIDGYLETFKWFDWLKQEIQNQMANWQDIVPNRALGLLPTLGTIDVRLGGALQIIREGERPQFSVDKEKAIELLQGTNLYSTEFACIRELLQNAVDATLLRLWITEGEKQPDSTWEQPFSKEAGEVLRSLPIQVELAETPSVASTPEGMTEWKLTIIDQGTGISRADLEHMLRIGGSQGNVQRQSEINKMPEWMKPSGAFGIGMQSVFLICDEITLTTKSIYTNEVLQITMYSPTGENEGLVRLEVKENDVSQPYGTTVEMKLQLDTFAKSWSISMGDNYSIASQFINSMDPVLDEKFPYKAAKIADQISIFLNESPVRVIGKLKLINERQSKELLVTKSVEDGAPNKWNFVSINGHELAIQYEPFPYSTMAHFQAYYRGQKFECKRTYFLLHVNVEVNLMSGKAGTWLTANRDALMSGAKENLEKTVLAALEQQVEKDLHNSESCELLNDQNLPAYSLFLEAMALHYRGKWKELALNSKIKGKWLDLYPRSTNTTFRDFLAREELIVGEQSFSNEISLNGCDLLFPSPGVDRKLLIFLNEWLEVAGGTVQVLGFDDIFSESPNNGISSTSQMSASTGTQVLEKKSVFYQLKRESQPAYSKAALTMHLAKLARGNRGNQRYLLNCYGYWSKLFLKAEARINAAPLFIVPHKDTKPVLLPFLFRSKPLNGKVKVEITPKQLDAICQWVQPHLITPASLDEIREAYLELIHDIDNEIMKTSPYWDVWKTARGLE